MTRGHRPRTSLLGALRWFAASYGLAMFGYLAANAVASRWLGLTEYGYFVIVLTASTVVGQLALLGAHRGGLREAAVLAEGDEEGLRVLRGGVSAALRVTLPLASVVGGLVVWAVSNGDAGSRLLLSIGFAALVALGGLQKLWANYLRGFGEIRLASLIEGRSGGALVSLLQAVFLTAGWLLVPESGIGGAVAALALGFALPVLYAGRLVTRRWRHLPRDGHLWSDLRASVQRNWRFAVNQLATYLGGNVEIWIAGVVLLSTDASLFSAAQRLALLLAIPLTSIQVVFAPVAARLLASGETARLQRVLRTGATLAAAGSTLMFVPILALPGEVLGLVFGGAFAAGATALVLLTLGNVANVASGQCGVALTMSRHEGVVAGVQGGAVVLRVVFGSVAAYLWGLPGLAVTAACLTTATYLVLWVQARTRLGLWTHPTLRPSLAAIRHTAG